jgi:hypothetical protein
MRFPKANAQHWLLDWEDLEMGRIGGDAVAYARREDSP